MPLSLLSLRVAEPWAGTRSALPPPPRSGHHGPRFPDVPLLQACRQLRAGRPAACAGPGWGFTSGGGDQTTFGVAGCRAGRGSVLCRSQESAGRKCILKPVICHRPDNLVAPVAVLDWADRMVMQTRDQPQTCPKSHSVFAIGWIQATVWARRVPALQPRPPFGAAGPAAAPPPTGPAHHRVQRGAKPHLCGCVGPPS